MYLTHFVKNKNNKIKLPPFIFLFLFFLVQPISQSFAKTTAKANITQAQEPTQDISEHLIDNLATSVMSHSTLHLLAGNINLEQAPENPFFGFANVKTLAEELAAKPFVNPDGQVPNFLINVSYDQWRALRFNPEKSLWKDDNLPFEIQFFHPGLFYNRFVAINIIDENGAEKLPFDPSFFIYGDEGLATKVSQAQLDYAGFRIHFPINTPEYKDEIAVFLGATYFRAVAKDTQYGLSARGLAIDTALSSGEEFPYYREFWIEKPTENADRITLYALMDSASMTGAYKYVIIPSTNTIMQVDCSLFLRKDAQKIGIAPLTSMYLYGEPENGWKGDFRPEVHDSDGLLMKTAEGQYLWSPLANPQRLAVNSWRQNSIKGFGFFQRDNNFDHYQDLEARYERRPTLWIEPKGDWGRGFIELIEIPSELEIHDNTVAFFVPEKPLPEAPSTEQVALPYPKNLNFSYSLYWIPPGQNVHNLASVVATRIAKGNDNKSLRFLIDFEGEELNALPEDTGMASVVTVPQGLYIVDKQIIKNPITGGWRLVFQVALPKNDNSIVGILTNKNKTSFRFEASLKKGENIASPLTETWVYDLQW